MRTNSRTAGKVLYLIPERVMDSHRPIVEALDSVTGYDSEVVHTVEAAMERLNNCTMPLPQVIVVEEYDFGWDGVPFIKRVRRHQRAGQVPIIALSTDCDPAIPDRRRRALEAGATAFFIHPSNVQEIAQAMLTAAINTRTLPVRS